VFKGGTSLSKAYQAIARFSEDVDLTYDIRAIASDLIEPGTEAIPMSRAQEHKWSKAIRDRLDAWAMTVVAPALESRIAHLALPAKVEVKGATVTLTYESLTTGTGYIRPVVLLEFGARSTGEPCEPRSVTCDAAPHVAELLFPSATVATMRPERTFWEKATAIHVFCLGGKLRGDARVSRHWYDVVALDDAGFAATAIADRELANTVARHKNAFFREKDGADAYIDYANAAHGTLQLVPGAERLAVLREDYSRMVDDGLIFGAAPPFELILERCTEIQQRANGRQ